MNTNNDSAESKNRIGYRIGQRIIAVILIITMLGGMMLMFEVQIRDLEMQFLGTVLEQAHQVTNQNTEFLSQSTLERAWRVLKSRISKPNTYDEFDTYASLAIAKGDYAEAQKYMQGCIDTYDGGNDEELAMLWLRLGSLHTLCEEQADAIDCYNKTLELNPKSADALLLRAQMRSELGQNENAIEDLLAYQKLAGRNPVIQAALGSLYENAGSYTEAVECYEKTIKSGNYDVAVLASSGRCHILCGDNASAKSDLKRFFSEGGQDTTGDIYAMLGMCFMEDGEYTEAIDAFHSAIDLNYQDQELLYWQCITAAFSIEDYDNVVKDAERAIILAETNGTEKEYIAQLYMWLGYGCFCKGEYQKAVEAFDKSLELNPEQENIRYYSGVCCMGQELLEDAVRNFEASAERGEYVSASLYNCALCRIQMEQYQEAVENLKTAIKVNDDEVAAGEAKAVLDSLVEAIKQMEG